MVTGFEAMHWMVVGERKAMHWMVVGERKAMHWMVVGERNGLSILRARFPCTTPARNQGATSAFSGKFNL
jgi:hypothetical protein